MNCNSVMRKVVKKSNRIKTNQYHLFQSYSNKTVLMTKSIISLTRMSNNINHHILTSVSTIPKVPIQSHPKNWAKISPKRQNSSKRKSSCLKKSKTSIRFPTLNKKLKI